MEPNGEIGRELHRETVEPRENPACRSHALTKRRKSPALNAEQNLPSCVFTLNDGTCMTRDDLLTHDSVTQSVAEWALDFGLQPETILRRLRNGMSVEVAITKPLKVSPGAQLPDDPKYEPTKVSFEGRSLSYVEWAEVTGLPETTIRSRIRAGWSAELALKTAHRNSSA